MEIKGIIAAMATAMYEDGSINESEIRNQVNRHIRAGVDGIFCLGTNGEFYILSTEEKSGSCASVWMRHEDGYLSMQGPAVWARRIPLICRWRRRRSA